jgi:hypothetical protein
VNVLSINICDEVKRSVLDKKKSYTLLAVTERARTEPEQSSETSGTFHSHNSGKFSGIFISILINYIKGESFRKEAWT